MTRKEHEEDTLREVQGYKPLNGRVEKVYTYCASIINNSWHMNERQIAGKIIDIINGGKEQRLMEEEEGCYDHLQL